MVKVLVFRLVALAGSLLACEGLARILLPADWIYPTNPNHYVFEPHPERNYALIPGIEARWTNDDYDIAVHINRRGLRGSDFDAALAADLRVVAGGDSLTFGLGVEAEDTWSGQLERLLQERFPDARVAVLNSGVPGYGPAQIRQVMSELIDEVEPALAIFAMSASTYYRMASPYLYYHGAVVTQYKLADVTAGDDGVFIESPYHSWIRPIDLWAKRHFHLLAHLLSLPNAGAHNNWSRQWNDEEAIREGYQSTLQEISTARRYAEERGVAFALLIIHRQRSDGSFDRRAPIFSELLVQHCEREGIAYVEFLDRMRKVANGKPVFRFPTDNHWNARAHRMGAEELDQLIRDRHLLDGFRAARG